MSFQVFRPLISGSKKNSHPLFHKREKIHTAYFTQQAQNFAPLILHGKENIPYSSQNGISDMDFSKI